MLRVIFLLGLFSTTCGCAPAQLFSIKHLSAVGIESGGTFSRISSRMDDPAAEDELPDGSQSFSTGLFYGAQLDYALKPKLRLSAGLRFLTNAIHYRINEMAFADADSTQVPAYSDERHGMRFFSLPLSVSYVFSAGRVAPFLTIGTAANFYLGTREEYSIHQRSDDAQLATGILKHRVGAYNRWNYPLTIGGGARYPLSGKLDIGATLAYNHPLRRLLRADFVVDASHRVNYLILGAGIHYRF